MVACSFEKPRWQRDLIRFLPLKSQFVLSGNIKDLHLYQHENNHVGVHKLSTALDLELREQGYVDVVHYSPASGFSLPYASVSENEKNNRLASYGIANNEATKFNVDKLTEVMEAIALSEDGPIALIADFASQYLMNPDSGLVKAEHTAFARALVCSQTAQAKPYGSPAVPFFNSIIWLVDKEGDLPDWLLIGNPKLRHVPIAKPEATFRRILAENLLPNLPRSTSANLSEITNEFVDQTDGLLLLDLKAIVDLARTENIAFENISDAVRRYKIGVTEDPWLKIDRAKVANGEAFIKKRVKGQDHAVTHILDIVKRGITGVGSVKRGNRPRGVVFLAGPTGVGKTELAKTLTSLLFGDENAYIRFDMSEFSAEHSDQRLIGAPPGYVGYDVGGELTNAIREKPFSVVLFDEIEKAHPRILDKFLQVLDDGRLTSGRGDEVYFSEALIVFTSNLGVYKRSTDGSRVPNVKPEDDLASVSERIKAEISRFFKLEINRPELLNRIGENVIVFDFIRPKIAKEIFMSMFEGNLKSLKEQLKIEIEIHAAARTSLQELCLSDLSNGGRGIRNQMEKHFINPLARGLFDLDLTKIKKISIDSVDAGAQTSLEITSH